VLGYGLLLELISGSEYGYISIAKRDASQGINALCNVFPSCHGHSPDTGTLTEDMSLFGLFEELIVARARKLKTLLINLDYRVMLSSDESKHYNDRQPGRKNTYQLL